MSKRTYALIAIIVAGILWSTAGVAAKTLVKDVSPFVVGFWRFFIASLCIIPFCIKEKKSLITWRQLLIPSTIAALNVPLYYVGIQLTTANSASLIFTAGPLVTAVLSYILIREKNSLSKWIGILLGLVGVLFIILLPVFEKGQSIAGDVVGNVFITSGMLSWTIYTIWSRKLRSVMHVSPLATTAMHFFVSSLMCLILALVTQQSFLPTHVFSYTYIGTMVYSALFLTLVTYFLFQWAIEHVSATTASFKQYIETVFAVLMNAIFLGETLTLGLVGGGLLVILGLTIATIGKVNSVRRNK